MVAADRLSQVEEYFFSRKLAEVEQLRRAGNDVINLGIGSPDLSPPVHAVESMIQSSRQPNVHGYQGYRGILALRQAISRWYERWYDVSLDAESEILPLMGSKEGIMHVCMSYLDKGDKALVPNPGYPTYKAAVSLAGGIPLEYHLTLANDWTPDFEALEKSDLSGVKIMWVNYPNMPTGRNADIGLLQRLIDFGTRHKILICHDNPYSFILNDQPISILSVTGALDYAIELNSLSKTFNMAGWRVGMILGNKDVISNILRFKSTMDSGMFLPIQQTAIEVLKTDVQWHQANNAVYLRRKEKVLEMIGLMGGEVTGNQTGLFVWAGIPGNFSDSVEFCDYLLYDKQIFVTPGIVFGSEGDRYFRVSLCSSESIIDKAIQRI